MTSVPLGSGWLQIETGLGLSPGVVAAGGRQGYADIRNADGSANSLVHAVTSGAVQVDLIMGAAFDWNLGTLYLVTSATETGTNIPHDVAYIPDGSGILAALVVATGSLQLRKYSLDGLSLLDTWTPTPPPGWAQQAVKIDVACDSDTVGITYSLDVVNRFSLGAGLNLSEYQTLPAGSPRLLGGFRWASREAGDARDAAVAETRSGHGPQRAVALGASGVLWTDEINPTGSYHLVKRRLSDGAFVASFVTRATPTPTNDRTLSLASYYNPCAVVTGHRIFGFITGTY